ncbi:AP-4 complex subunit beta-1-like [Mytilus galloprovincialis]|uniref:AP-4 complex subunit beta-1-like n=1 Tax=Mytilus galloprovincialis TaxID=29158 RepID=UPI003F7BB0CA
MAVIGDVSAVLKTLKDLNNSTDILYIKTILSKVMSLHAKGFDVREALPKIVKLLANQDLVVKKALYNILITYSFSDPDVILLATNTLLQECSDSNPMVRGLAIKTICTFNHETFLEYGIRSAVKGLTDSSAYVRRTAVLGCGQLNFRSKGVCHEHGIVDQLYRCIRDSDPVVMVNSIVVLEEILAKEGGIVLNKNIAHFILGKIETLTPWGVLYCFQILQKYQPKAENEIFDILNILDPYLTHNNNSIAVHCFELFLHFVKEFPSLKAEVIKRCFDNIVNVVKSGNPEVVFCVIEFFEKYMNESGQILSVHYKMFKCKQKDPAYLKVKKIDFMRNLLNEGNVSDILDEIQLHSTDSNEAVSLSALQIIAVIQQKYPDTSEKCCAIFTQLLKSNISHVITNCLRVMQKIDLSKSDNCAEFLSMLCHSLQFIKDDSGRCAMLTLLGNYGNIYEDAPYVLEDFIEDAENFSTEVKVHLLHCCMKMFFHYPGICQHMLGRVFEICFSDNDECLQNIAVYYYSLLQTNIEDAKHVIMNCKNGHSSDKDPSQDNKL